MHFVLRSKSERADGEYIVVDSENRLIQNHISELDHATHFTSEELLLFVHNRDNTLGVTTAFSHDIVPVTTESVKTVEWFELEVCECNV